VKRVLILPQFNESKTVLEVLSGAAPEVDHIVVVNDGSTDTSALLVTAWMLRSRDGAKATLINLGRNHGMSGALLTGLCYIWRLMEAGTLSESDIVLTMDADGQHDPGDIPGLCTQLEQSDAALVLGRRDMGSYPAFKRFGNTILSAWATCLSGSRYIDVESGFRAMRAWVVADLLRFFTGWKYTCAQEIGIIASRAGHRVDNSYPVKVRYYRDGARVRDGLANVLMGAWAFVRVELGLAGTPGSRADRVLKRASIVSAADLDRRVAAR
jgi:glycosyltransferase involved in cell wall biosynthesis